MASTGITLWKVLKMRPARRPHQKAALATPKVPRVFRYIFSSSSNRQA